MLHADPQPPQLDESLVVFTQLAIVPFSLVHLGTTAQVIGQVTFSLSYVVVIIRGRLFSIGNQY